MNYTFRMHDPRVGRFFSIDPLTSKYPWYSPYQFAGNKVIQYVELEGMEESPSGSNSESIDCEDCIKLESVTVINNSKYSGWQKAKAFGQGFIKGVAITIVVTAAVTAVVASGGTAAPYLFAVAATTGSVMTANEIYKISTGYNLKGQKLDELDRWESAGELTGGIVGGFIGSKAGNKLIDVIDNSTSNNNLLFNQIEDKVFVDLMSGPKTRDGFITYDIVEGANIVDDVKNFTKYFEPNSVDVIEVNNPMAPFFEHVDSSIKSGGTLIVRGQFRNSNFSDIWDNPTPEGYTEISRVRGVSSEGYYKSDGTPIENDMNELILKKN